MSTLPGIIGRCRAAGMRRTALLEKVLDRLLKEQEPVTIHQLQAVPGIGDSCDTASLYRLLHRLEDKGIVRRVGLHERAAHFLLNTPGHHRDYVVCTECGSVKPLDMTCPAKPLEDEVSRRTGYRGIYHELQFYGRCPECADAVADPSSS